MWQCVTEESAVDRAPRAFLAVKHASLAMGKANPERGKPYGGGSIVLVASGKHSSFPLSASVLMVYNLAQSRESGRELVLYIVSDLILLRNSYTSTTTLYRQCKQSRVSVRVCHLLGDSLSSDGRPITA